MNSVYERTEKQMIDNEPIELFRTAKTKWTVKLRSAATIDAWLEEADAVVDVLQDIEQTEKDMARVQQRYVELQAQFAEEEAARVSPIESLAPAAPVTETDVAKAYEALKRVRKIWREKFRAYLDGVFDCLCKYDEAKLDKEIILREGITDEQVLLAFTRLRMFSDPLVSQQTVTGRMYAGLRNGLAANT